MSHESPDSNDNNQSSIPDISSGQTKDLNDSNRTTESSISSSQTKELNSINTANSGEEKQPPNQSMDLVNEMYKMQLLQGASSTAARDKAEAKVHNYKFWATQPVPELDAEISENTYIQPPIPLAKLRSEPYSLPENYVWSDIEIGDAAQLDELYTLLTENYVEDDENMFRFDYSREFLKWALLVPGWHEGWHCGVRLQTGDRLLAFIAAIPATIRIYDKKLQMAEINFLCVHKKLRSKRVAPVLIREITRRVNLTGIFQATFTAGIIIPKPIGTCRYWHRSLNPKKLIETNFSHVGRNMTLRRTIKLYKLPEITDSYLKAMRREFLPSAYALLTNYLTKYSLAQIFSIEQFEHMMMPREDVIYSYVIETGGNVTDLISFYCLPSTIVNHPVHRQIKAAYSFYNVATTVSLPKLMHDALILAKNLNFDLFNALDLMENRSFLDELKFGIGDGNLQYYLYNWKCPDMKPEQIGLVLQ